MSFEKTNKFYEPDLLREFAGMAGSNVEIFEDDGLIFNGRIVNNKELAAWIRYKLDPDKSDKRPENFDLLLTRLITEHTRGYVKQHSKNFEKAIVLVHPFYTLLRHMKFLDSDRKMNDFKEYIAKLIDLFKRTPPLDEIPIIVLEALYQYTSVTSLFLEAGLIDEVVITWPDSGLPLSSNSLGVLNSKQEVYLGGGYNSINSSPLCLPWAINEILSVVRQNVLWAVSDLIINSPRGRALSIKPDKIKLSISNGDFQSEKLVQLEEIKNRLGNGNK